MSSPFGITDLKFLIKIGIKRIKIPSGELNNKPLLEFISKQNLPVILSTGMATLREIKEATSLLLKNGLSQSKLTLLHCTTDYPTKLKDVNLKFIETLSNTFNLNFGYSDHTSGIEIPMAATAMGCSIIEKHITLDKSSIGPDHAASLNAIEFKKMVESIRNIDIGLGKNKKILSPAEKKNKLLVRKSIVANQHIKKGQLFTIKNITTKRPGTGISPMKWNEVLGKKAKKNFYKDQFIQL